MKLCKRCDTTKPREAFSKNKCRKDGLQTYCKECSRKIDNEHYKSSPTRREYIIAHNQKTIESNRKKLWTLLIKSRCKDCKENDPIVLQFDHLRDKTHNISEMLNKALKWETIQKEIDKCEIVCANCHARRTSQRGGFWRQFAG